MSLSLVLGAIYVICAAVVAMLPMRLQYWPAGIMLLAAPLLLGFIGYQHGWIWVALGLFAEIARPDTVHQQDRRGDNGPAHDQRRATECDQLRRRPQPHEARVCVRAQKNPAFGKMALKKCVSCYCDTCTQGVPVSGCPVPSQLRHIIASVRPLGVLLSQPIPNGQQFYGQ
jgi:hypothetical protein